MNQFTFVILVLTLGGVQADFSVGAKANVVTPDKRPAEGCAVAMDFSREPPREPYMWQEFRGQFRKSVLTSVYDPIYVHVRCKGWRPVVRRIFHVNGRGWSSDSTTFPRQLEPVDLGTIKLEPSR